MNQYIPSEVVVGTLSLAGGFIVRMVFDRRKLKAENASAELEADTKAVELYERYAARVENEIMSLKNRQDELTQQVAELRLENTELKIQNKQLHVENEKLKQEINDLYNRINNLK